MMSVLLLLTRRRAKFHGVAEAVERLCRIAEVEVSPGIAQALTRRWFASIAATVGVTAQSAVPPNLARLIADDLIEGARVLQAQRCG